MIGRLKDLIRLAGGEYLVSFTTRTDPGNIFDDLKNDPVKIEIKKASKHRSLSANNFAWVLIDQIAEITGKTTTEVYQNAIREIGGISDFYGVREEAVDAFTALWNGDHLGRQVIVIPGSTKPGWVNVRAYKGSSDFDSAQMSRLLDSLIQDAENLGIPTISDKEFERMVSQWGKSQSSRKTKPDASDADALPD